MIRNKKHEAAVERAYREGQQEGYSDGVEQAEQGILESLSNGSIVAHGSWVRAKGNPSINPNDIDILYGGFKKPYGSIAPAIAEPWAKRNAGELPVDIQLGETWDTSELIVPSPWGTEAPFEYIHEGATPVSSRPIDRLSSAVRGEALEAGAFDDWISHKRLGERPGQELLIIQLGTIAIDPGYVYPRDSIGQTLYIEDEQTMQEIISSTPIGAFDTVDTIRKALGKHAGMSAILQSMGKLPAGDLLRDRILHMDTGVDDNRPTHMILNFGNNGPEYVDYSGGGGNITPLVGSSGDSGSISKISQVIDKELGRL